MLMFVFRLAKELGMTVKRLLDELGPGELEWWLAYYSAEPFGERRDDLRSGIVAATIANCNRSEGCEPFSAADFMPPAPGEQQAADDDGEMTEEEIAANVMAAFRVTTDVLIKSGMTK